MAASREKVLYFEPQPSEQTAALKTVLVRMGVRIKNCLLYTSPSPRDS